MKDTLRVDGRFHVGAGGFKGVPFDSAESSISFDGTWWRLPDLRTTRPEGQQQIAVNYNDDTRAYRVDARGIVDPPVLRPIIGEKSAEVLDLFEFRTPVDAVVSVWGPWTEGDQQSIVGTVRAADLLFRGHRFDRLETTVVYTNRSLVAAPARLTRDAGELTAVGARYDFDTDRLALTNVVSSIDPAVVAAAISPDFPEKLRHYRFDTPPKVRVEGTIQPRQAGTADLTFDIEGGPFHFWRFSSDRIATRLLWQKQQLTLTNITASFYRGSLDGDAVFDLSVPDDAPYRFTARVKDAHLEDLLHEATQGHTNITQGIFDLTLDITSARTSDLHTWNGLGTATLRDGLLWDTPIFDSSSPVLNAVIPGLGNNRAKRADSMFVVSNGISTPATSPSPVHPLAFSTAAASTSISGSTRRSKPRSLATWPAGSLFGLVLRPLTKLFEYRVEGTLTRFDAEPLYALPKVILFPLQPLRVIRDIFTPKPGAPAPPRPDAASTNAPPEPPKAEPPR